MSRIGKMPITMGEKVKAQVVGQRISLEGPKGKMSVTVPAEAKIVIKDGIITIERQDDSRRARAMHGLARTIVSNAATGVHTGFERRLDIRGVGFRAEVKGKSIHFALGFSHPIVFGLPDGVTAEMDKQNRTEDGLPTLGLTLRSVDKEALGATAVKIRALRPPEPYKGKGIKYSDERVRRKEGKTGTA